MTTDSDRPVALVVEDDTDTRRAIANFLRTHGWSVFQAATGDRALLMAREHVPDVILLDLALPTMSGLEVLETLKSWHDQPTRVIVVSAFAMLMHMPDLRRADAVLQKPFVPSDLLAEISRLASRSEHATPSGRH